MAEHPSDLVLEEVAVGMRPSDSHVDGCERCRLRLNELRDSHQQARRAPRFETTFAKLQTGSARPKRRGLWALIAGLPVAAAAVIAVMVVTRTEVPTFRLKSSASIEVLRASDGEAIRRARVGEEVVLAVGAAGLPYAMVLAVEEDGTVAALWPQGSNVSVPVPPGAAVELEPGFEVTAGSVTLHALFSDEPLDIPAQIAALRASVERAPDAPLTVELPKSDGVDAAARVTLQVEGGE